MVCGARCVQHEKLRILYDYCFCYGSMEGRSSTDGRCTLLDLVGRVLRELVACSPALPYAACAGDWGAARVDG
jgi:hypothetical protein